ncbi:MAG: hypothetical protein WAK26_08305 [Terracidiphilus sp.]
MTHPLADNERRNKGEKETAPAAVNWLKHPTTPKQEFSYAEYLANQPQWTGPDPEPEDE